MATTKIGVTPPDLNDCKSYESYKRELQAWKSVTELGATKQGNYVVLSLPNKSKFGNDLRERVFENISATDLASVTGLDKVIEFLDTELGKSAVDDTIEKWDSFDNCKRGDNQTLEEFISEFEAKSSRVKATGTTLPGEILAYMLMKRSGLSNIERMLVLSRVDISKKESIYREVKTHMTNILGKCMKADSTFKLEPAFLVQNEDVLAAAGYYRQRSGTYPSKGKYQKGKSNFVPYKNKDKAGRPVNPKGKDGNLMTCNACGSYRHLIRDCSHKFENKGVHAVEDFVELNESINITTDVEEDQFEIERFILFTSDKRELSQFTAEAINCAALDTCCTSTVAGEKWLNIYLSSLPEYMKDRVQGPLPGRKSFQFGNQGILKSQAFYKLPARIVGHELLIEVDIIPSDIPMLLSKEEMKRQQMILYMLEDSAEIRGASVSLSTTSAGHYLLPLLANVTGDSADLEAVLVVDLKSADTKEKVAALDKIHKQFGHRPKQVIVNLLKSADAWTDDMGGILDKLSESCEGCIHRKRNPDRPVVAAPLASEFNERVAIDLKIWKNCYILYMVDMWSRLTIGAVIKRKTPEEVVNSIFKTWIAHYGVMGGILHDNGGEFTGFEMQELKSKLNVINLTTGAESPWQNGLCERNHALCDNILLRLDDDFPSVDLETKVAWACMAKNSLQNVYGYSPNQLVFGLNPRMPNILSDGPPSWEEGTVGEKLAKHLNVLHAARRAFTKSESCQKLKLALKSKIRTSNTIYNPGDSVYFKRERDEKWYGPGKVIFQDGKVIFVRYGSTFVRVSANRLTKTGSKAEGETDCLDNDMQRDGSLNKGPSEVRAEGCLTKDNLPAFGTKDCLTKDNSSVNYHEPLTKDAHGSLIYEIPCEGLNNDQDTVGDTNDGLTMDHATADTGDEGLNMDQNTDETAVGERIASHDTLENPRAISANKEKSAILLKRNDRIRFQQEDEWHQATITGRSGKATGKNKNWFNIRRDDGTKDHSVNLENTPYELVDDPIDDFVLLTDLTKDEKQSKECQAAKETELKKLKDFDTYEIVDGAGKDVITTTWVLGKKEEEIRARLVARGFEEEDCVVKDSPTLAKSSLRVVLAIIASKEWPVETTDIKSAFLQGSKLDRDVFVKPPKEAGLDKGKVWKLKKCLYGLRDASRQWYLKVKETLLSLGCEQHKLDPGVFFFKDHKGDLCGVIGLHVDDFIHAGNELFDKQVIQHVLKIFKVGKNEKSAFMYTGFYIRQDQEGIVLDQENYTKNTIDIPDIEINRTEHKTSPLNDDERTCLRRMTGSINWVVRATRPDLSFEMIELSTKFKSGTIEDLLRARKCLLNIKQFDSLVKIPNTGDPANWEIVCFTDASLGNLNNGIDSAGGHIVFLRNTLSGKSAVLDWQANKIKRVVRSTLAAETLSLCEGLESAVYFADFLQDILQLRQPVKVRGIIDNKSTTEAIRSTTVVSDKRLRRDIASVKEMLLRGEVSRIDWVPGDQQLADVLTKRGVNGVKLLRAIQMGRI